MKLTIIAIAVVSLASTAQAAPVITGVNATLTSAGTSFTYLGNTFTFSATGDIFNPIAVQDQGTAATGSFGGFLGIPVTPTSSFTNRGTVTFGPSDSFATFTTPTTVPYSNGKNFIGLRATSNGLNYFGFAYTTNNVLNSYGFETVAGATITATTAIPAAVPEAATWAMMMVGLGVVGGALRRRQVRTVVKFA